MEYKPSYTDSLRADILPTYSDSLMHHGIKGQKWGVRRYQNSDGSYTKSGLLRRHLQAKQMQMRMNHVDRVYINDKQRLKDRTRKMRESVSKLSKKQDRSRWDNIVLDEHKRWLKINKNEPQRRKRQYDRQIRKMISEANKQGFDVHSKAGKRWVQKQKFNGAMNEVVDFALPVLNYGRNRGTKYKVTPRKN